MSSSDRPDIASNESWMEFFQRTQEPCSALFSSSLAKGVEHSFAQIAAKG
jgi:hypothetical protein